jgi:hypothetical protein
MMTEPSATKVAQPSVEWANSFARLAPDITGELALHSVKELERTRSGRHR